MKCPTCDSMDLMMTERSGIEIDYCPTCRGVWLDRGELDKIIERNRDSQTEVRRDETRPRPEVSWGSGDHHRRDDDHRHGKHYRKKSFLEELFD